VIPSSHQSIPDWQRLVALNVNPLLTQYIIDSANLTYSGNAHKLLRINAAADGVELSSNLNSVTLSHAGTQVAATAPTGIDLSTGMVLSVAGTRVIGARITGWGADTGTDKRTANATYAAGTTLTFTDPPTAAEMSALATRIANIETGLQNASRTQKSLKADLFTQGIIGT
jgi:hypothetical protein